MKLKNIKQTLILILLTSFASAVEYQTINYVSKGGNIERVTPTELTPTNNPSVELNVSSTNGYRVNKAVQFKAIVKNYSDAISPNYVEWDFDADGIIDQVTQTLETTHTFSQAKVYEAKVYLHDSRDGVVENNVSFTLLPQPVTVVVVEEVEPIVENANTLNINSNSEWDETESGYRMVKDAVEIVIVKHDDGAFDFSVESEGKRSTIHLNPLSAKVEAQDDGKITIVLPDDKGEIVVYPNGKIELGLVNQIEPQDLTLGTEIKISKHEIYIKRKDAKRTEFKRKDKR